MEMGNKISSTNDIKIFKDENSNNVEQEYKKKVLNFISLDAERLYIRVIERQNEYLRIYSSERIRTHFAEIFFSRYYEMHANSLLIISEEVYNAIETFYNIIEEFRWYLTHTQDLPGAVKEKTVRHIKLLKNSYVLLKSYLHAEYLIQEESISEKQEE